MKLLRLYLLIKSENEWQCSTHQNLKSLTDYWQPSFKDKKNITGFIHVGFIRPETDEFNAFVKLYPSRMILTASAKWALLTVCECAPVSIGDAVAMPLYVALNGWGYEVSSEELGLSQLTERIQINAPINLLNSDVIEVDTNIQTLTSTPSNRFGYAISDEYIDSVDPLINAPNAGLVNLPIKLGDSIEIVKPDNALTELEIPSLSAAVPLVDSILLKPLDQFELSVRTINRMNAADIYCIGDLVKWDEEKLLKIPNLGEKSLSELKHLLTKNGLELGRALINESNAGLIKLPINFDDPKGIINSTPTWLQSVLLEDLFLQERTYNSLHTEGHTTVGHIKCHTNLMLLGIKNFGKGSLNDLVEQLKFAIVCGPKDTNVIPIRLNSQFRDYDSLFNVIKAAISSLEPEDEKVIRGRLGVDTAPMTLDVIGKKMDITRARVGQREEKSMILLGRDPVWKDILEVKLVAIIDNREKPLSFKSLDIYDPWFNNIDQMFEPFKYLLKHEFILNECFSILKINDQLVVSRLSQEQWGLKVKHAMALLKEGVNKEWSLSEAKGRVTDLLIRKGRELREELWNAVKSFAIFAIPANENNQVLVAYGDSNEALVNSILIVSERPLHFSEIQQLISDRFGRDISKRQAHTSAGRIALLYGRGTYGLLKHCPLTFEEREEIKQETLDTICNGNDGQQWATDDLVAMLIERGMAFGGLLNSYTFNISLIDTNEVHYLGRNVYAAAGNSVKRIDIRQAVTTLLKTAGNPMTTNEIEDILQKDRGINRSFQIYPNNSIISLGKRLWGLVERDLPINDNEQAQLIDIIEQLLRDKESGIHLSEIVEYLKDKFTPISSVLDPLIIFAIAQRSVLINKSKSDYLFLSEWGNPRRKSRAEVIFEILDEAGDIGLTLTEIIKSASIILGREITKDIIHSYVYAAGAVFNQSQNRWILTKNDDLI